jgi:hypothetical protein
MSKGMFTQGVSILLERAAALDDLASALREFDIRKRVEAGEWEFGGPTLIVVFRPEVNGLAAVDTVSRPWPDHMGDPQAEPKLFAAWSMGNFGPFAFPGSLERAAQQCWAWAPGKTIAERHTAFLRIRSSYAFGAQDDDPIMPRDYEPLAELEFVTRLAAALLELPGALCYFNPNGEVLRDGEGLRESLEYGSANNLPPLDAWCNVRLFNVDEQWSLMDTVGNSQLDIPDVECCFHSALYDFNEVDNFARNASFYLLQRGEVIKSGDTMDGPGGIRWQAEQRENGICEPPRRVLRWRPQDNRRPPDVIINSEESF